MTHDATTPLKGVRILDLTNVLAGPYCCYQLGLLGAEVIKVERPLKGDLARQLGADPALNQANMGISFLAQNAGKKSMTLDLKSAEGKQILHQLVKSADILVENFRPDVMARLNLSFDELKASNPELIYCSISGFGQDGPWKNYPAYDQIVQGFSGVMSITGDKDSAPLRVGYPLADTTGGINAAFAIAAALNAKPRGCFLDISMTESVISAMGWVVSNHLIGSIEPSAQGNENSTSAPSGTFNCADEPMNISANKDEQWLLLAEHLGLQNLIDDPDYTSRDLRKKNRIKLRHAIEAVLITKPSAHWVAELAAIGVPVGPVLTVPQILQTEQIKSRHLLAEYPHPFAQEGKPDIELICAPVMINQQRPTAQTPPPKLGQDTAEILTDLGIDDDKIKDLKQRGIL